MKSFPHPSARARATALVLTVLALTVLMGACGVEASPGRRLPRVLSTGFPLRVECEGREFALPAPPGRVLPTNAAWVDFLSLLVPPGRVVALPGEAFGYSRLTRVADDDAQAWSALPDLAVFEGERVLALRPDLVLVHAWQDSGTVETLHGAGVPVLVVPVPESWDEIVATLELLGKVLGTSERATRVVAELEARRAALARRSRPYAGVRALTYTNLGAGGWTTGARTTGDVLLELAGLDNAAARAGLEGIVSADHERVLALAPDLFLVGRPDRSETSPPSETFLVDESSLAGLEAVRERRIFSLPPALFTSASPELLTGAEELVSLLEERAYGTSER